ncbi:NAD(P)-dependent oxidoreductase [Nonomuraea sp. NPDC048901]|uniref:NAD(P)-dependent oxidoreductase n=1 Tax=Nonomuraea sp. NPDC048901 TaxID=3155627 RepID=UPI0033EC440E
MAGGPGSNRGKNNEPVSDLRRSQAVVGGGRSNYRRVVGIVGLSHTGRRVAHLLRSFDLTVLASDPYATEADAQALGTTLVPLPDLLHRSDIVTLHAPSLPETRNLLNADRLALLPDHATVINTARGSLIDTGALTAECVSGRLSAILDVTDPEPLPVDSPLFGLARWVYGPVQISVVTFTSVGGASCAAELAAVQSARSTTSPASWAQPWTDLFRRSRSTCAEAAVRSQGRMCERGGKDAGRGIGGSGRGGRHRGGPGRRQCGHMCARPARAGLSLLCRNLQAVVAVGPTRGVLVTTEPARRRCPELPTALHGAAHGCSTTQVTDTTSS